MRGIKSLVENGLIRTEKMRNSKQAGQRTDEPSPEGTGGNSRVKSRNQYVNKRRDVSVIKIRFLPKKIANLSFRPKTLHKGRIKKLKNTLFIKHFF